MQAKDWAVKLEYLAEEMREAGYRFGVEEDCCISCGVEFYVYEIGGEDEAEVKI